MNGTAPSALARRISDSGGGEGKWKVEKLVGIMIECLRCIEMDHLRVVQVVHLNCL